MEEGSEQMVSFPMYVKQQNSEISKNSEEDTLESENLKDELKNELESSFDILATNVSDIAAATGTELEGITKQENAAANRDGATQRRELVRCARKYPRTSFS